jgi:hypothetical protein
MEIVSKKEYYFDDLVMSNILSFIPKYPKKAKRYDTLSVGVFEDLNTLKEHESKRSNRIIIITRITPKMVNFSVVDRHNISIKKKRKIYNQKKTNIEYINWGKFIYANKLIPIREMTMNKIMDRSWFASNTSIDLCIHYIRNPQDV